MRNVDVFDGAIDAVLKQLRESGQLQNDEVVNEAIRGLLKQLVESGQLHKDDVTKVALRAVGKLHRETHPPEKDDLRVVEALCQVGIQVSSIWDLVNGPTPANAIPVLVRFVNLPIDPTTKDGVVRALTVREARGVANEVLLEQFRRAENESLRWTIGNAVDTVATEADFDQVAELVRAKKYGSDRQMLVHRLGRMKNPRAVDVLLEVIDDEDVRGHAIGALGILKAQKARPRIERYVNHPNPWIRKVAKKALERIDKPVPAKQRSKA